VIQFPRIGLRNSKLASGKPSCNLKIVEITPPIVAQNIAVIKNCLAIIL